MKQYTPQFLDDLRARVPLTGTIAGRVRLVRRGREHIGLCPFHNEKTPSFTVSEDKGFYKCFGCGAHGDVIAFVQQIDNLSFREAVERLARDGGAASVGAFISSRPPRAAASRRDATARADTERRIEHARELWHRARPAEGTPVEKYLRERGITIPIPPTIRYLAAAKHSKTGLVLPALVGAIQDVDRRVTGVIRIFLTADGTRKAPVTDAKMMLGKCVGGAVRLGPARPRLRIGEGLETALSVAQACPDLPTWATLSTSGMRGLVLPPEVSEITFCCDGDIPGNEAARVAARRFVGEGRLVKICSAPAGRDFNDVLLDNGPTENAA